MASRFGLKVLHIKLLCFQKNKKIFTYCEKWLMKKKH